MEYKEQIIEMLIKYTPMVVGAIFTLVVGFWLSGYISRLLDRRLAKRGVDESVRPFLVSMINIGFKVMVVIAAAGMFGIETTSFIAILGALAFAIGMALQGSLGHFASGVLILVFKPYKVGDFVEIGGSSKGTVESIQIFNTILKTADNKRIVIPNGVVTSHVMTNITGQGTMGIDLTFGIGYSDDIDLAKEIILKVGKSCPEIHDEPEQMVVVSSLGDSSVNLFTRPFTNSENFLKVKFYMQEHVKKEFDKAGVGIPFPQMDVHMIPQKSEN